MEPRARRSRWISAAVIVALIGVAFFLPELVGFGWHAVHGKETSYRGWRIPVPPGWFAMRHGESLTLEHMLHIPLRQSIPTVVFLPMHVDKKAPFHRHIWTEVQTEIQSRRGYRLSATREIRMSGARGYCWEFVKRDDQSRWWITCLVPGEDLSADFSGGRSYAAVFYAILPRIRPDGGAI